MNEQMTGHGRITRRQRATAVLGVVALALLQVSMAAHQFEHVAEHGLTVCHACGANNQLEDAPRADVALSGFRNITGTVVNIDISPPESAVFVSSYRSRAPPHS